MDSRDYVRQVNFVSLVTLVGNGVLTVLKLLVGVLAHSAALVSDAVHSLSDFLSTIVVLVGVHVGAKKSDKSHPFGHERLECVATMILAAMLVATALFIGVDGVNSIVDIVNGEAVAAPTYLALIVAIISVLAKGWMYLFTEKYAKRLKSGPLHGDAMHHLSDSLSSIGAAVGIVGAMLGVLVLDAIASIFIACMIVKAAVDICKMAVDGLTDKSADDDTEKEIAIAVLSVEGVERIDVLRTRLYSNRVFVEVEIAVADKLTLLEAHAIAEAVHERVEHGTNVDVKHCMVHVNPLCGKDNHEDPKEEMEE